MSESARPPRGVVAAGDTRTAEVGAAMLRSGGNAVDAAVASCFAAFVAEPVLTGPFGGGFANVAGAGRTPMTYDFFADAPGRGAGPVPKDLDFVGINVDFGATTQTFHVGRGAMAATAMLQGLVALHQELGRRPLAEVVEPAIAMAAEGVPVSAGTAGFMKILSPIMQLTPPAAALFAPGGTLLREGDRFVSPDLSAFLRRVAQGDLESIRPVLLRDFGPPVGRITADDLDATGLLVRPSLSLRFGDREVLLNPLPSSGGTLVAFGLKLLERVPSSVWRDETQTSLHLAAAMATTSMARTKDFDPSLQQADGDFEGVQRVFLGEANIQRWMEYFFDIIHHGLRPQEAEPKALGSTTHISVVDADGLCCAITSSNGEGCGHVVQGAGVLANNFMGEDDLHPHGFHRHPVGTRLTSMMCPTVVLHQGRPDIVLGTGGSNRIRTALLQVLARHILVGESMDDAVYAPRMHYEGNVLLVERRGFGSEFSEEVLDALRLKVPQIVIFEEPAMFFGGVHAADGHGRGVGDPRRSGAVAYA